MLNVILNGVQRSEESAFVNNPFAAQMLRLRLNRCPELAEGMTTKTGQFELIIVIGDAFAVGAGPVHYDLAGLFFVQPSAGCAIHRGGKSGCLGHVGYSG